jgi:uncharacterized membrane protein
VFLTILLIIHVIGVIIWIGGVTFVTTVIFPMMYKTEGSLEKALLFQRVEHRFSAMVKWLLTIVGLTGFILLSAKYSFALLSTREGFGVLIMLSAWSFYAVILLFERKIFAKIFSAPEKINMNRALKLINGMHWVILSLSFLAVAAGVWFGHYGR